MSFETSKCYTRRYAQGHLQKLEGEGIDIGGGSDCLKLPHANIMLWDKKNGCGDAQIMQGIKPSSKDFIYSSHTLEHMKNPIIAINNWMKVIKPNGYLYVAVPDFMLYEGGIRIKNGFHKCAFSMNRDSDAKIPLYNIFDFIKQIEAKNKLLYVALCDENYDYSLDPDLDQTKKQAVCHIEFFLQKTI